MNIETLVKEYEEAKKITALARSYEDITLQAALETALQASRNTKSESMAKAASDANNLYELSKKFVLSSKAVENDLLNRIQSHTNAAKGSEKKSRKNKKSRRSRN